MVWKVSLCGNTSVESAAERFSPPGRPCCWSSGWAWPSPSGAAAGRWCSSPGPSLLGSLESKPPDYSEEKDLQERIRRRRNVCDHVYSPEKWFSWCSFRVWPSLWGWILLESFPWRGVPADLEADVPPSAETQGSKVILTGINNNQFNI